MVRILIICVFFFPAFAKAQFSDTFSDGELHANPIWRGDTIQFEVNAANQLHLHSSGTDSAAIYVASTMADSTEWSFWIKHSFAGSASNNSRVYLMSSQSDFSGPLNGYFLQFGEALSSDAVQLFRQAGTVITSVCRGPEGQIAGSFAMGVKVRRSSNGYWRLYLDSLGGKQCIQVAAGMDNAFVSTVCFGLKTVYTSGNSSGFYFDDFYAGPIRYDHQPPGISSILATASNALVLHFSEPVALSSAALTSNYSASDGLGHPLEARRDSLDFSIVYLRFATAFVQGHSYTLAINGIADLENNVAVGLQSVFMYYEPAINQVVFSEIMADVSPPQGLPECEYLELYNRSGYGLLLHDWKLAVGDNERVIPDVFFPADSFLILTSQACADALAPFGRVLAIPSFSALTNTGNTINLIDRHGRLMHTVSYTDDWYKDASKAEGGYSLESIDLNNPCAGSSNWQASMAAIGGTPGAVNAAKASNPDEEAPYLTRASFISPYQIGLYFSEPMDSVAMIKRFSYSISPTIGTPAYVALDWPDFSRARLILSQPLLPGLIYRVSLLSGLSDCVGQPLFEPHPVYVAIPDSAQTGDLLINEVLYNARDEGVDFVELYNASNKVLDLSKLRLGSSDSGTDSINELRIISADGYLIFPREFKVLTSDKTRVSSQYKCGTDLEAFIEMSQFPSLSIEDDCCALLDAAHRVLDLVHYRDSWQFPLLTETKGVSLERVSAYRPSSDSTNWHSAAVAQGYATPGYLNSQHSEGLGDGSEVSLEPSLFSPDDDGVDDVLTIHYAFSDPGYTARVLIYDLQGRLVRVLINNVLLGTVGAWSWDGIRDTHDKADIGIYIVYVAVFRLDGTSLRFKRKVVLAGRL